jgi:hypothetical protein
MRRGHSLPVSGCKIPFPWKAALRLGETSSRFNGAWLESGLFWSGLNRGAEEIKLAACETYGCRSQSLAASRHARRPTRRAFRGLARVRGPAADRPNSAACPPDVKRLARPRGRVPSTAARTMSGARKARESPIRADRSLMRSRAAIASMPTILREAISSSHRRPLATAERSILLASARIGRPPFAAPLDGWITSRSRRKVCGDHEIAITLEGWAEPSRNRISMARE